MNIFTHILNMSLTVGYVILIVLLVRLPLKKVPAKFSYILWIVVLFKLVFPLSIVSEFSLVNIQPSPIPRDIAVSETPKVESGISYVDNAINSLIPSPEVYESVNPLKMWLAIGVVIWITGIFILLLYSMISYIRLKGRLIGSIRLRNNIYLADNIQTPFVIGLLSPKIFLPSSISEKEQPYIILHEQIHIKRFDYIIKIVAFLALCVHWFNPLVWLAFLFFNRDMEMSCDEAVLRNTHDDIKKDYSSSLVAVASGKGLKGTFTPAFGEYGVKGRVKNVFKYKTPSKVVSVIASIIVLAVCIGCASNNIPASADNSLKIAFPANQDGKTDYNAAIYEIEPFNVSMILPEGWEIRALDEANAFSYARGNFFTPVGIYNGEDCIGIIGYNTFTPYEEEIPAEQYYQTVYPYLRLSSMYIWEPYTPIKTTADTETAIVTVNYKDEAELAKNPGAAAAVPFTEVPGILSYDKKLMVYIGIQFAQDAVTDEQVRAIAESLVLER